MVWGVTIVTSTYVHRYTAKTTTIPSHSHSHTHTDMKQDPDMIDDAVSYENNTFIYTYRYETRS
jgi:hypothetical protein